MRYLKQYILSDLKKKMVFLGGPRQVGKTTFTKEILKTNFSNGLYLNWDFDEHRRLILQQKWSEASSLLVFDELHKYPRWKNWLKGVYDVLKEQHKILVTGSARLDTYKRSGDSMIGQYHFWRLHPFSLDELPKKMTAKEAFHRYMLVGGFPEPFLNCDEREARRWRRERLNLVFREDIRDLERVREIRLVELFLDGLRSRVTSSVVLSNIASDLEIAPKTAKAWLEMLERMYLVFSIYPFSKSLPRSILKPPKVYFWDCGDLIGDEDVKFENLVALHLLKRLHFLEDQEGYRCELRYLRDKEGREVDFAVIKNNVVEELIEVKWSDENISSSLRYYAERLKPKKVTQLVGVLKTPFTHHGVSVVDPVSYFSKEILW